MAFPSLTRASEKGKKINAASEERISLSLSLSLCLVAKLSCLRFPSDRGPELSIASRYAMVCSLFLFLFLVFSTPPEMYIFVFLLVLLHLLLVAVVEALFPMLFPTAVS